jgi:uroporphyrinogen-III synthase
VALGQPSAEAASAAGLDVAAVAARPDAASLVDALLSALA